MGAVYSVNCKLMTQNEDGLIKAVREYMSNADAVFDDSYKPDSVENIARIFLAATQGGFFETGSGEYASDFDASYGWESVLFEWWQTMRPFLRPGSYIKVCPDEGGWKEVVRERYTDFTDDKEKMKDFFALTKEEFLDSYSYLTEEEYDLTREAVDEDLR